MFSLFASQELKMRRHAANWLEVSEKVWNFRRDRLTAAEATELTGRTDELRQQLKDRADAGKLKLSIEALEGVLRKTGGAIYPQSTIGEYVEFFLVAAIVILGFRTYFIQPFKIPTNSMWPTYYGMTAENIPPAEAAPSALVRAARLVLFGAQRKEIVAPTDGEISVILYGPTGGLIPASKPGRSWLVFPTMLSEYALFVNGQPATVMVPADFHGDFDRVFQETFFGSEKAFADYWDKVKAEHGGSLPNYVKVSLGKTVKKGDLLLRFDILTGDQLFVDRFSYHFFKPQVGQGFVFRTDNIHSPYMADRETGNQIEQYYIKRLVGTPGDVLEQKTPVLYRNAQPITGAEPFAWNAKMTGLYRGYGFAANSQTPVYLLPGTQLKVPAHTFFAMGDNSYNSSDGRFWGFVPEADVIGRPLFIYYPFTKRWGLSK